MTPKTATPDTDAIADRVRTDILDGVFTPGERLVELQLCERYACGRAMVRAALMQLESEGLVEKQANRGAVVRRISLAEAIEITEARNALESLIAARAARVATDAEVDELLRTASDMRDAVARDDAAGYSDLNRQLHGRLRDIGRHSVAGELVRNLRNRAVHHQYRLAMMPGRQEDSLEQHIAIVEAIAARDESAAHDAMSAHLQSVVDVLHRWRDAP